MTRRFDGSRRCFDGGRRWRVFFEFEFVTHRYRYFLLHSLLYTVTITVGSPSIYICICNPHPHPGHTRTHTLYGHTLLWYLHSFSSKFEVRTPLAYYFLVFYLFSFLVLLLFVFEEGGVCPFVIVSSVCLSVCLSGLVWSGR